MAISWLTQLTDVVWQQEPASCFMPFTSADNRLAAVEVANESKEPCHTIYLRTPTNLKGRPALVVVLNPQVVLPEYKNTKMLCIVANDVVEKLR